MAINFFKDYKKGQDGKYIYVGKIYRLKLDDKDIKKMIRKNWLIILLIFLLEIICGLLPFKGMIDKNYLIIPYLIELIISLMMIWANFHFSNYRDGLTNSQYQKGIINLKIESFILLIIPIVSIVSSIIYVILNGFHLDLIYFLINLIIKILIIVLSYIINKTLKNLEFVISNNDI